MFFSHCSSYSSKRQYICHPTNVPNVNMQPLWYLVQDIQIWKHTNYTMLGDLDLINRAKQ